MDLQIIKTIVLGLLAVAAAVAAYKSRGDKAFGFWLLAVGCAMGAA